MNDAKYRTTCPHCGHQQTNNTFGHVDQRPVVINCDQEAGGCDETYAVKLRQEIVIDATFTLSRVAPGRRRK